MIIITTKVRNDLIKTAQAAIKAAYGTQQKLSLEMYRHVEHKLGIIIAGDFVFESDDHRYGMVIENGDVTGLERG